MVAIRFKLTLGILVTLSLSLAASGLNGAEHSSRVPSSAQSKISATIGSDIPRYYARTAYAGFTLTNSPHDFVTDFTSQGVEVKSGDGRWGFALLGYGYGDALTTVSATSPQASANRVEYRRRALTEWYVNGPAGLEQGFTINERPLQTGHEPLTIGGRTEATDRVEVNDVYGGILLDEVYAGGGQLEKLIAERGLCFQSYAHELAVAPQHMADGLRTQLTFAFKVVRDHAFAYVQRLGNVR